MYSERITHLDIQAEHMVKKIYMHRSPFSENNLCNSHSSPCPQSLPKWKAWEGEVQIFPYTEQNLCLNLILPS